MILTNTSYLVLNRIVCSTATLVTKVVGKSHHLAPIVILRAAEIPQKSPSRIGVAVLGQGQGVGPRPQLGSWNSSAN
jgi:hypothetical protein